MLEDFTKEQLHQSWQTQLSGLRDLQGALTRLAIEQPESLRLDAVQGNSEARTELYSEVLRRSTGAVDDVMRQESGGLVAEPTSRPDGGGDWNG